MSAALERVLTLLTQWMTVCLQLFRAFPVRCQRRSVQYVCTLPSSVSSGEIQYVVQLLKITTRRLGILPQPPNMKTSWISFMIRMLHAIAITVTLGLAVALAFKDDNQKTGVVSLHVRTTSRCQRLPSLQ
jgi:hypothetical protein